MKKYDKPTDKFKEKQKKTKNMLTNFPKNKNFQKMCGQIFQKQILKKLKITKNVPSKFRKNQKFRKMC